MTKEIRIVAMSDKLNQIWVQTRTRATWRQKTMNPEDFEEMMKKDFPQYWEEYKMSGRNDMLNYFYSYGQKGSPNEDTYIFRS